MAKQYEVHVRGFNLFLHKFSYSEYICRLRISFLYVKVSSFCIFFIVYSCDLNVNCNLAEILIPFIVADPYSRGKRSVKSYSTHYETMQIGNLCVVLCFILTNSENVNLFHRE